MNANSTRRPKALLLDDDPTVLRLLATALLARGFEVRAATGGEAGVQLLLDELLDLDVLVADRDLPGRDGAALLRLVREAGGERELAVVILAEHGRGDDARQLLSLGADAVVDRALGLDAAVEAIAGAAPRRAERARRGEGVRPAPRGPLLVLARGALARRPHLAAAPA